MLFCSQYRMRVDVSGLKKVRCSPRLPISSLETATCPVKVPLVPSQHMGLSGCAAVAMLMIALS